MKLRRLFHSLQRRDLRQNNLQQPCFLQQFKSPTHRSLCKKLSKFIAHALRGNLCYLLSMQAYSRKRGRLNAEPKTSGKSHRPQQSELVLSKAPIPLANPPNHARPQINLPADVIEPFPRAVPPQQPIYRESTSLHVLLPIPRTNHTAPTP